MSEVWRFGRSVPKKIFPIFSENLFEIFFTAVYYKRTKEGAGNAIGLRGNSPRPTPIPTLPEKYQEDQIMKHELQTRNNNYDLFDVFDDFFKPMFFEESKELRTDIKETDHAYELDLELPGYAKDEIKITLEKGYLTVTAAKHERTEDGKKYLRREIRERTTRSYYVGSEVKRSDVKAKYGNGILSLTVPKAQPKETAESFIEIE